MIIRRVRTRRLLRAAIVASLLVPAWTSSSPAATRHPLVVRCPFAGGFDTGDRLDRGFYVTNYAAADIHSVTLRYIGDGSFTVTLTARRRSYDGPLIGTATRTVDLSAGEARVRFLLRDAPVRPGSTVTFTQQVTGTGDIFYDTGRGQLGDPAYPRCPGVTQTDGTRAPLGHFRRASVGLLIRS